MPKPARPSLQEVRREPKGLSSAAPAGKDRHATSCRGYGAAQAPRRTASEERDARERRETALIWGKWKTVSREGKQTQAALDRRSGTEASAADTRQWRRGGTRGRRVREDLRADARSCKQQCRKPIDTVVTMGKRLMGTGPTMHDGIVEAVRHKEDLQKMEAGTRRSGAVCCDARRLFRRADLEPEQHSVALLRAGARHAWSLRPSGRKARRSWSSAGRGDALQKS